MLQGTDPVSVRGNPEQSHNVRKSLRDPTKLEKAGTAVCDRREREKEWSMLVVDPHPDGQLEGGSTPHRAKASRSFESKAEKGERRRTAGHVRDTGNVCKLN